MEKKRTVKKVREGRERPAREVIIELEKEGRGQLAGMMIEWQASAAQVVTAALRMASREWRSAVEQGRTGEWKREVLGRKEGTW